jgi:branched-chain amino acid transport system permease protein
MNAAIIQPIAIGTGIALLLAPVPLWADGYGMSLAISMLSYAVLATAWAMFSGPTRYISLATVAFFGVGAYAVGVLGETMPWPLVLAVAALAGILLALVVGLATMRLAGAYFVIFTFGLTELIRQVVTWYEVKVSHTIGRYVFLDIGQAQIYWQLLAVGFALFLTAFAIGRSRLGFSLRIIGGDEAVARHVGIDTARVKVGLFALSALFMTLTGAIMAPRWTYIDPAIAFNPVISFQVVIMALLGGVHRLYGPVLGVIPLTLLGEYLNASFPNHSSLMLGLIFLAIVYLLPKGVAGLLTAEAAPRRFVRYLAERTI